MPKFTVYYEEGGDYKAKAMLEIEAETKEEAIQKVKDMPRVENLVYDYEPLDCEAY